MKSLIETKLTFVCTSYHVVWSFLDNCHIAKRLTQFTHLFHTVSAFAAQLHSSKTHKNRRQYHALWQATQGAKRLALDDHPYYTTITV